MQRIALIPGAARPACNMWPLQARRDKTIYPIDYKRGVEDSKREKMFCLTRYAERVYAQLPRLKDPIDLFGWSMGGLVAIEVMKIADKKKQKRVRKVVLINPGVFGGPPPREFHNNALYQAHLMLLENRILDVKTSLAVQHIKAKIPNFRHKIPEDLQAMREAGDGVIMLPKKVASSRFDMLYCGLDTVIPRDVSEYMAERAGIEPLFVRHEQHNLPLTDTSGKFLQLLRERNP